MSNARRLIPATLCTVAGVLLFAGAPAQAAGSREIGSFGPKGPGVSVFSEPQSIAVEQATGDVFVYDVGAGGRIYKFNAAGEPVDSFSTSSSNEITDVGGGAEEGEIAVDSSASGPDKGDIYVATGKKVLIYDSEGVERGTLPGKEPCGVAVDPSGAVYVAASGEHVIKKYTPKTNPVTKSDYTSSLPGVEEVCNIAADAAGDIYAAKYNGGVREYEASQFNVLEVGAIGTAVDSKGTTLAVDPSTGGDLYIDEGSDIAEYTPSGIRGTSFGSLTGSEGVAESHASGKVYGADGEESKVVIYDPASEYPLAVTKVGHGSGEVKCEVGKDGTPAACAPEYPAGAEVTLTATANSGSEFSGFSEACAGDTCEVTMNGARSVTARFALQGVPERALTVTPKGSGSVSAGAGEISACSIAGGVISGTCSGLYDEGETVTLTATPEPHKTVAWSGCTSSSEDTCTVKLGDANAAVTATFATITRTLTVIPAGAGSGSVSANSGAISDCAIVEGVAGGGTCSGPYEETGIGGAYDYITLTATHPENDKVAWSECTAVPSEDTCWRTIGTSNITVTATFTPEAATTYPLKVIKAGSGKGTVTSSSPGIDCLPAEVTCEARFPAGETVTLAATAEEPGSRFEGWSGCEREVGLEECEVAMTEARSVTAEFNATVTKVPPTVTSIAPTSGSSAGGTAVIVEGTGFVAPATVTIGSAASAVTVLSETEITAETAATAAGGDEVIVGDANGVSTGGPTYTYTPATAPAHQFIDWLGPRGLDLGAFEELESVAVEQKSGDVYVYEMGEGEEGSGTGEVEGRVYKFNADGKPEDFSSSASNVIKDVGGSYRENEIAVDSSSGLDQGDIYVANGIGDLEIYSSITGEKLGTLQGAEDPCGVAVDPSGDVYVATPEEEAVKKYTPTTQPVSEADYTSSLSGVYACNIAADSAGDVYASQPELNAITRETEYEVVKYDESQFGTSGKTAIGTPVDSEGGTAVAVDPSAGGDVYVDEEFDIAEYDSSGKWIETFGESGTGELKGSYGVAVSHSTGEVYATTGSFGVGQVNIYSGSPASGLPEVKLGPVSDLRARSVTLNGTVDPGGETPETSVIACEFEYGSEAYDHSVPCSTPVPFSGDGPVPVSAPVGGLEPDTTYEFRLSASNATETNVSSGTFTTTGVEIKSESVSSVTSTSANLLAGIDPHGVQGTYYFQYGTGSAYGASLPAAPGLGFGAEGEPRVIVPVRGLAAGTTYHYRVVVIQESETFFGPDETFTTQSAGGEFVLPDGRQYELVSPPDKHGAKPDPISGGVAQAAEDGEAITYRANASLTTDPAGNLINEAQMLSTRGSGGWSSQDIATPHDAVAPPRISTPYEYTLFSPDLSLGLVAPQGDTPLSSQASERTVYLRDDPPLSPASSEAANYLMAAGEGGYLPLVTSANVPAGTRFGGEEQLLGGGFVGGVKVAGATPDLSHVVLESTAALTEPPIAKADSLYEWGQGQLQLVSVLPKSDVPAPSPVLGSHNANTRHAVSNDGSRIVWTSGAEGERERHLYMRDMTTQETVQLDANQGAEEPGEGEPVFQTASAEGSKVFFTDERRLTADSTAGGEGNTADLYECEIVAGPSGLVCDLTDLTVDQHKGESADVQGLVAGASEDGSYIYFVADGVLAYGAVPGKCNGVDAASSATCNLYVRHAGTTTFIATLSSEDNPDWGEGRELRYLTARVSPDGEYLAFMSDRPLSGYDNTDVDEETGQHADEEVFLYDASTKHLVCASCDPSNARPVGLLDIEYPLVSEEKEIWGGRWLAGNIPGWTEEGYQSRYLSDSGRLFFNSSDALVPQDVNGKEDVYQYEPPGVGSCEASSATFSADSEGCVGLISSGTSDEESAFLDASPSGDDVFFLTSAQLSPEDHDTVLDVYDARSCETEQCFTAAAAPAPPCDTSDSCKAAPSPQPEIFGPSGSETFSGAGNLAPPQRALAPRPLTRAQKLAKALKACKGKAKKKRASCEAQARKRYGSRSRGKRSHEQAKRSRKVHAKQSGR